MSVQRAVILGTGLGAMDCAVALVQAGLSTTLIEDDPHAAERASFFLSRALPQNPPTIARDLAIVAGASVVIDALECDAIQRNTQLARAAQMAAPQAVLLTLTDGAGVSGTVKGRLVQMHLFAPSHLRRLVELAPVSDDADRAMDAAVAMLNRIGKTPVRAPLGRASIGTRLERKIIAACEDLLMQGAIPHEVDEAMTAFGFDLGPFETQDLIGLDRSYADRKASGADRHLILDRMVEEGRLGQKVGVGFYRYPGGGGAVIDPLVEDLIREEARFAGVEPRELSAEEIVNRLVQAMVNEGAAMLSDGTARQADDINTVARLGFGYPNVQNGLMGWKSRYKTE